jgi:hypothetical protein
LQLLSDGSAIEFNLGSDDGTEKEMKSFFFVLSSFSLFFKDDDTGTVVMMDNINVQM